jgi:hypothetical protein
MLKTSNRHQYDSVRNENFIQCRNEGCTCYQSTNIFGKAYEYLKLKM